jgi:hypothetical protein
MEQCDVVAVARIVLRIHHLDRVEVKRQTEAAGAALDHLRAADQDRNCDLVFDQHFHGA